MRTRISTNMTWAKYIFGAFAIILLFDLFYMLYAAFDITNRIQIEFILALFFLALHYYFSQRKNVEYDANTLYIIFKKKEALIALSEVTKISLTLLKINSKPTWKIYYKDDKGLKQSVRLIPNKHKPEAYETFLTHIKGLYPNLTIETEAKSF